MVKFPRKFFTVFSIVLLSLCATPLKCHALLSLPLILAEGEEWLKKSDALSKLPAQIEKTDDTFVSPLQKVESAENLIGAKSTSLELFGFSENDPTKNISGAFFITNFRPYNLQIQLTRYSWGWKTRESEAKIITSQKTHVISVSEFLGNNPYTHISISIPLQNGRTNHICSYPLYTLLGFFNSQHLAFVNEHNEPLEGKIL